MGQRLEGLGVRLVGFQLGQGIALGFILRNISKYRIAVKGKMDVVRSRSTGGTP